MTKREQAIAPKLLLQMSFDKHYVYDTITHVKTYTTDYVLPVFKCFQK